MKIFDRNYVGIDRNRDDVTAGPLAFLTPYEDNSAGKKRRDTVDSWLVNWRNKKSNTETKILDNKPKSGFKIVDYANRWTTSNKFARVYDPDGFELEISMANLVDLMLFGIVDHGEIMCDLIWAREGAYNRLIPVDSDLYRNSLKEGQVLTAKAGDKVIGNYNHEYVYLGQGVLQPVVLVGREDVRDTTTDDPYYLQRFGKVYTLIADRVTTKTAKSKPEHVYLHVGEDRHGDTIYSFTTRKNPMKITANLGPSHIVWSDNDIACMPNGYYYTAEGEFVSARRIGNGYDDPHRYYGLTGLFRSEPFEDTDLDFSELEPRLKNDD